MLVRMTVWSSKKVFLSRKEISSKKRIFRRLRLLAMLKICYSFINSGLPFSRQVIGAVVAHLFWLCMKVVLSFIAKDVVAKGLDHDTFIVVRGSKVYIGRPMSARSLRSDRARPRLGRYVATEHAHGSVATQRPSSSQARSLRSDRAPSKLGRYVATKHAHGSVATLRPR
ncbi:hypothetical protein DY000_02007052 [Brassica cretica]|uniref:Uncharacterized protein n=1 Tax=Brassica cretica TaxID=69181 RepID=A0ABQ7BWU6_BRACR|nr:hypothetical protein DY000_02007052 [Brassica cretica]